MCDGRLLDGRAFGGRRAFFPGGGYFVRRRVLCGRLVAAADWLLDRPGLFLGDDSLPL
jgi:hypothetical protein